MSSRQVHHYVLTVKAQDSGATTRSSTVSVYVNVVDENDNSPIFDPGTYSNEVVENATIGTSILAVTATDIDSGRSGACWVKGCFVWRHMLG